MRTLADRLRAEYGSGYGLTNLKTFRQFYLAYGELLGPQKGHAVRDLSGEAAPTQTISETVCRKSWKPGLLQPNLSWTHYRTLLHVDKPEARRVLSAENA